MDLHAFLKEKVGEFRPKPGTILEIGARDGSLLRKLSEGFNARGFGIGRDVAEVNGDTFQIRRMSTEEVSSRGQRFDLVYSIEALRYFNDSSENFELLRALIAWRGRAVFVDRVPEGRDCPDSELLLELPEGSGMRILKRERREEYVYAETAPEIWKLAAAVEDDGRTICPKMFGMAPGFAVYAFVPGEGFQFLEIRANPYQKTLQRGKTFDVYELVSDCQALLAGHIGKKGIPRLRDRGVQLFFGSGDVNTHLQEIEKC